MSQEMIQPLNGISSELEAIKNMVGSKDGGYPFVLFPVRVETRFMEEDQIFTLLEEDLFYDFQDTVFELEYLSNYTLLPQIEVPEFIELAGTIVSNLETANTQILKTLPVDAIDKRKLETVHDNFRSNISKVETKLKRISAGSSSQAVQANQLLTQIRSQKKILKREFTNQEVSGQTPWSDASRLLDQVNTVKRTVKKINNKDLNLSRKESKTRVYPYLDKKFDDLNIAYQAIKQVSRDNLKSTKTQFNRIQELRAEIQNDVQSVPEQLIGIASDFKRDEYQLRFQQLKTQQLDSMLQELDEEILPKMNYLSALQRVSVKDMLFDARKMLRDFKFKNAQQVSNYKWIKSTREDMYEQLRPFRADSRKIIEGSPEDIQKLKSTWSAIDHEIARFTSKIQLEFKPKTRTERSGLSRTITHLTDEYRKDLEGLKLNSDQSETIVEKQVIPLGNKDFTNSAKAYHQAQKGLSSINQKLKGLTAESKPKASAINALHQELIGFTDSYAQLEKATTVLPNAFYQEIQSNVQTLQSEMNTLNGIIDTQQITGLNFSTSSRAKPAQSVNMMKSTASSYYADVVDETDHFYDETRNSIIFATHTFGTRDVLWVRMYPDDIMVDSHEDALTQDEVQAGRDYWNEMFVASGHKVMENAAWNALCADFGARRAVWVAKETKPDPDAFQRHF